MKNTISSLFLLFLPYLPLFSQSSFFTRDSVTKINIKVFDNGRANFKYCNVIEGGKNISFSPHEVSEYGLANGRRYESKDLQIKNEVVKVFMERLVKGKTNLYYFRGYGLKTFFYEKDDEGLVELPRIDKKDNSDYKNRLVSLNPDCSADLKTTKNIRYTRNYVRRYVEMNNDCEFAKLPGIGIGVIGGGGNFRFNTTTLGGLSNLFDDIRFRTSNVYALGLSLEYPIWVSNLALYSDIMFYSHTASFERITQTNGVSMSFINKGLSIPLMLKASMNQTPESLYLKVGPVFSLTMQTQDLLTTRNTPNGPLIDSFEPLTSSSHIGFSVASGLDVFMGSLGKANLELRYIVDFKTGQKAALLKRGGFYLLLGYRLQ
jgi:hypothetical protein